MDTHEIREMYKAPQALYEGHNKTILALCDEVDKLRRLLPPEAERMQRERDEAREERDAARAEVARLTAEIRERDATVAQEVRRADEMTAARNAEVFENERLTAELSALRERVAAAEALVEAAYREGWARGAYGPRANVGTDYARSDAHAALARLKGE